MKKQINLSCDFIHPRARMFVRGMQQTIEMLDRAIMMEHNRELNNRKLIPETD